MDPLSQLLSLFKPETCMAGAFDAAGDWSIYYPRRDTIKCCALVSGTYWLAVEGVPGAVRLERGDCFLLPRGLPFRLTTNIELPSVNANSVLNGPLNGGIRTLNGGGECFSVGGSFSFTEAYSRMLLDELPPVVHIRSESDKAELRSCLESMMKELREQRPGASLVAQQLATTILLQALRRHLEDELTKKTGWLSAMLDKSMKAAITSIHNDPAHRWTLQELAELAGMSRSIFALKFKTIVGTSPIEYLTRWRILLAGHRLTSSEEPISEIALSLGYESESSFRTSFRKIMACSPRQYRSGKTTPLENELSHRSQSARSVPELMAASH